MGYGMEELLPVVEKLVAKYTAGESTSVTYETAQQLMNAVLYCIHEMEREGNYLVAAPGGMSAQRAYETGLICVEKRAKASLALYHEILEVFDSYENRCLEDTLRGGMPEFFKWYDMRFAPQDTILALDYPVLRDLSGFTGIDRIYEFLICIGLEQKFLSVFPRNYVVEALCGYNNLYKEIIENLCEIVLLSVVLHHLAGKSSWEYGLTGEDFAKVRAVYLQGGRKEIKEQTGRIIEEFVHNYCGGEEGLLEYLSLSAENIAVRIETMRLCGL